LAQERKQSRTENARVLGRLHSLHREAQVGQRPRRGSQLGELRLGRGRGELELLERPVDAPVARRKPLLRRVDLLDVLRDLVGLLVAEEQRRGDSRREERGEDPERQRKTAAAESAT